MPPGSFPSGAFSSRSSPSPSGGPACPAQPILSFSCPSGSSPYSLHGNPSSLHRFVFFNCPYKRMTLAGCAKVIPERLKIDNSGDDAGGLPQGLGLVRKLPVEPGLFPAEVAVGGRLPVYGSQELQVLYELRGLHAEVRLHELLYLLYGYLLRAAGVDHDRDRVRHAYRVRELHLALGREPGRHYVLGYVPREVGSAPVDLRGVLARERAAAVAAVAAVGVDDYLPAGKAAVAVGAAHDELAGRGDVIFCLGVQKLGGDALLDDPFYYAFPEFCMCDIGGVLTRYDDSINRRRPAVYVSDGDLALAVRPYVREYAFLPYLGEPLGYLMGKRNGHGHELFGMVAGVAEHEALVARALLLLLRAVDAHGDIRGLPVERDHDGAGLVVEPHGGVGIADVLYGLPYNVLVVYAGLGRYLAGYYGYTGGDEGLAGDPAIRVFLQERVEYGVGY